MKQEQPIAGVYTAQVGTKMFRRADVVGEIRKLIAFEHAAADKVGAEGRANDFLSIRQKIAGYYEVLTMLQSVPVFINQQAVVAVQADAPAQDIAA